MEDFMRCGIVAEELDQKIAIKKISQKANQFAKENPSVLEMTDFEIMSIMEKIKYDELGMHSTNAYYVVERLVDVYNSRTCRDMHEQPEFDIKKELSKLQ